MWPRNVEAFGAVAEPNRRFDVTKLAATKRAVKYVCSGLVRGDCGHKHRSMRAAFACLQSDKKGCYSLGGGAYSDREVCRADGADFSEVEREEYDSILGRYGVTK